MVDAAIRSVMAHMMDDYVSGHEKADMSKFPVSMRNLTLKPKSINQELEDVPFNVDEGRVGILTVAPGWMGNVDVEASGVSIKLSFDPRKAARLAMRPNDPGSPGGMSPAGSLSLPRPPQPPPPPVPPRWCPDHDTSEKRQKREPHDVKCIKCGITYTTSYDGALLCPPCSDKEKRCLICGKASESASTYIPAMSASQARVDAYPQGGKAGSMNLKPSDSMQQSASQMNTRLPPGMQQSPSMQQRGLRPTESFPANGGQPGRPGLPSPPPGKMAQGQRAPGPTPVPMGSPMQGRQPMPRQQRRGPPPEEEPEVSFFDFVKNLTRNAIGMSDEEEDDVRPQRRR